MLYSPLTPARTKEIAERVFQPDILADHEYIETYRRKRAGKASHVRDIGGRRSLLSGLRICQIIAVATTPSRRREMALEKRLAVGLLL